MGRKKKNEDVIFCYYCDRIFKDEATLVQHQKATHFKCQECHRKLNTSSGLATHFFKVHKLNLTSVPKAKPGRDSVDVEIFGMAGVPPGMKPAAAAGEEDEEQASKRARTGEEEEEALGYAGVPPPPPMGMPPPPYGMMPPPPGMMRPPHLPPPGFYPPPFPGGPPPPGFRPPYGPPPGGPPPLPYRPPGAPPPFPGGPLPPHGAYPPPYPAAPAAPLFPVAPPPQAPLFPVAGAAAAAAPSGGEPNGAATLQPGPWPKPSEAGLLWTDEEFSIEEHRALAAKYRAHPAT